MSAVAAGLVPLLVPVLSRAQSAAPAFHPTKPVRLVSPLLAGGATDAIVRPIAARLQAMWNQPVVVDNRPGGGTIIGTQAVVTAPPDGHTFGVAISAFTINPSLRNDLPYDTFKDVTPITQIGNVSGAIVAHPSFAPNSVAEFIAYAKARPGEVSYATLGVGTAAHITLELMKKKEGLDVVHVPYAGSSAAYRELLSGRVPIGAVVLESALEHVKAGKLKVLAVSDTRRNPRYPDFPALEESLPGFGYDSMFGFIGPRAMDPGIAKALSSDILSVLAVPEVRATLDMQAMSIVASTPDQYAAAIRRDVNHWKDAVKTSGANVS